MRKREIYAAIMYIEQFYIDSFHATVIPYETFNRYHIAVYDGLTYIAQKEIDIENRTSYDLIKDTINFLNKTAKTTTEMRKHAWDRVRGIV